MSILRRIQNGETGALGQPSNGNGNKIKSLKGHEDAVNGVLLLSDGRILSWSEGYNDHSVRLWGANGKPLNVLKGHTDTVSGVLLLPDGSFCPGQQTALYGYGDGDGKLIKVLEKSIQNQLRVFKCFLITACCHGVGIAHCTYGTLMANFIKSLMDAN